MKRATNFIFSARISTFLASSHITVSGGGIEAALLHLKPPRQAWIMDNVRVCARTVVNVYSYVWAGADPERSFWGGTFRVYFTLPPSKTGRSELGKSFENYNN